jgi:hypothetical protein
MTKKLIGISEATNFPAPWEISAEEEAAITAQYKLERTPEAIEEDYRDFERQIEEGVPAEQLLKALKQKSIAE